MFKKYSSILFWFVIVTMVSAVVFNLPSFYGRVGILIGLGIFVIALILNAVQLNTAKTATLKARAKNLQTISQAIGFVSGILLIFFMTGMLTQTRLGDIKDKLFIAPTQVAEESAPTAAPTEAVITPTTAPVAQAPAAPIVAATAVPTEAPLPMTPAIYASLGTEFSDQGEYLDTYLGERTTFTCRKVVIPYKAWNETLNPTELKLVETTWVSMKVDIPQGMNAVVFGTELKQGAIHYKNGALLTLSPGHYEFSIKNGEIVVWYPSQETYQANDLIRIIEQIRNGNFDIKSKLEFFGVSADLFSSIPDDLILERNVQIIPTLTSN